MTKYNEQEAQNHILIDSSQATRDTEVGEPSGASRRVGGTVPIVKTRKSIRREMQERFDADGRGDSHLSDAEYDFICNTLGTVEYDDGIPKHSILPILTENCENSALLPPNSLTRGCPNSSFPQCPTYDAYSQTDKCFYFGGYDGGFTIGFEGEYREGCLESLCNILDDAKEKAGENSDGKFALELAGYKITVYASGVTEGLQFKYRIDVNGVRVLLRHTTTKNYQSIRVRFGAEVLMTNTAPANWRHLLEFFDAIGFVLAKDCISRVDFQLTSDCFTMSELIHFVRNDYVVTKLRTKSEHSTGLGSKEKVESIRFGKGNNPVQFSFYDKLIELHSGGNFGTQKHMLTLELMGDKWLNSNRVATRIEMSVKRDGLKMMGINSVDDLFGNEWAIINLLTQDWVRILAEPKIAGKEYKQKNHPIWDRVRSLFRNCFAGGSNDDKAEWKAPDRVSGDPEKLEKQALGCISKAIAYRYGEQATAQTSMMTVVHVFNRHKDELHSKINTTARHTENKSGIPLGVPIASGGVECTESVHETIAPEMLERSKVIERFDNPELRLRQ